jgi:hypothetical protein
VVAAWIVLVLVLDWCGVWHPRKMGCSRRLVRDFSSIFGCLVDQYGSTPPAPLEDEDEDDDEDENDYYMPQRPFLAPRF